MSDSEEQIDDETGIVTDVGEEWTIVYCGDRVIRKFRNEDY